MLLVGFGLRVYWAWKTYGVIYDIRSYEIIAAALRHGGGIGPYDTVRWPYPGGFLPLLAAADWVSRHLHLRFDGVVQLPSIVADMGIACLVAVALRWRGASERRALWGAGLVALGPSFAIISGYHGQIDALAALPALAGVLVWIRDGPRRALYAGLLIGLAASIKQPPGFVALALLPSARSWRERGVLLAAAVAVPVVSILPWLVSDTHNVIRAMRQNSGVPGFGGISALVQPDLTRSWATVPGSVHASPAILDLVSAQRTVVALGALAAAAVAWVRRVDPLRAASLLFLTIFVVNPNFGFSYLIWGLPFFIAAGYLLRVTVLEVVALPASLWLYFRPGLDPGGWSYLVTVELLWLLLAGTLAVELRRLLAGRVAPAAAPARAP